MLVRGPSLAASMSQYLVDQLAAKGNVTVETNVEVVGVEGRGRAGGDRGSARGPGRRAGAAAERRAVRADRRPGRDVMAAGKP